MRSSRGGWAGWTIRLCLLSWPRPERLRDGPDLLASFDEMRTAEEWKGLAALQAILAECGAVLMGGLRLRSRSFGTGIASVWKGTTMGLASDLRYAARTLRRNPGFTLAAILTLAVGVGANATMFSLVDNLIVRPLEYERPDELLLIWNTLPSSAHVPVAAPDVAVLRERARLFEAFAFAQRVADGGIETRDGAGVEHVRVALVTPDFFDVLGVEGRDGPNSSAR